MKIKLQLHIQLALVLSLVLGSFGILQHEDDDLVFDDMDEETTAQQPLIQPSPIYQKPDEDTNRAHDNKTNNHQPQHFYRNKVEKFWVIPDTTAVAGHMFKLKIPKQFVGDNVYHYKVLGNNNKPLPRWLFFDEAIYTLLGVPSKKDVGQQHHISVKAYEPTTKDDVANHLFTIQVTSMDNHNQTKNKDEKACDNPLKVTWMSILLDVKYDDLTPSKRVRAVEALANHLGLHASAISMYGQNSKEESSKKDSTVIFSGPGNVKHRRKDKHSTVLQWQAGCDGHLWKHQSELMKLIKRQSKDKTLSKTIQLPIINWEVRTNANMKPEKKKNSKINNKALKKNRKKGTNNNKKKIETRVDDEDDDEDDDDKGDILRSRREAGSGDFGPNNDNDDYDDNYDDYDDTYDDNDRDDGDYNNEPITEIPSRFVPPSGRDDSTVEELEPEHPHRHHHGQETLGWKPAENIDEHDIVPAIDQKYETGAVSSRSSTESTTLERETTMQTTPTTVTPSISPSSSTTITTTPSSIISSTSSSLYSTLSTTMTELETSPTAITPLTTPKTTVLSVSKTDTTNDDDTTNSESPETPKTDNIEIDFIEETNKISDDEKLETPLTPVTTTIAKTTTEIILESETISPTTTTILTTMLFNPSSTAITTDDRLMDVKTTSTTVAANTVDEESASSEMSNTRTVTQSSPILTTSTSKSISILTTRVSEDIDSITSSSTFISDLTTPSSATSTTSALPDSPSSPVITTITTPSILTPSSSTTTPTTTMSSTRMSSSITTTSTTDFISTTPASQSTSPVEQSTLAETRGITTEKVDYEVRNYPPRQNTRLKKVPVTAGKPLSYFIPANTFSDLEDGDTRKLKLALYLKGNPLKSTHWLQFNAQTQEVYGLPLEDDVSVWNYDLVASDRDGLNVSDTLDVYVQQHKLSRSVNHEFKLYIKILTRSEFPTNVDWQLKIVKSLAELYGDSDNSLITVRSIELSDNDQAIFSWTNDSIPRSSECPKDKINKLYHVLIANKDGDPSAMLQRVLSPEIRVKRVTFRGVRQCEHMNNQGLIASLPPAPPFAAPEGEESISQEPKSNESPMPRNQVDHISATVGQLLIFRVPEDTFYDPEDGSTRHLKLSLLKSDRTPIPPHEWLQFDVNNQEFYGVPMKEDIRWSSKEQVKRLEYQLIAADKDGASANDNLVVEVQPTLMVQPSAEFTIKLGINHKLFSHSAMLKKNFIQKLRDLFGDRDTNAILLTSILRAHGDNNTMITWRNTTLPTSYCPNDEITRLSEVLFVKPDNKELTNRIERIMGREFPVDQLTLTPMGICLGEFTRVHSHDNGHPPSSSGDDDDSTSLGAAQDDYLLTFVLPAIIISAMLILAGIIACVLYKRKRSGKMSVSEHDDERQTFRSKGIPVIFQDELEEKPDPGNKSPVILKEEKPPLPPPEYQKVDDGADQPMLPKESNSAEPYQPPPPFARTSDNTRQNRPKPTPTYRKPPPYVPP